MATLDRALQRLVDDLSAPSDGHGNADGDNGSIHLLRLRLRYGTPRQLRVGHPFVVVVEVVDEMAQQPPSIVDMPTPLAFAWDLTVVAIRDGHTVEQDPAMILALNVSSITRMETATTTTTTTAMATATPRWQWRIHATLTPVEATEVSGGRVNCCQEVRLSVTLKGAFHNHEDKSFSLTPTHLALQRFCVGSQWLTRSVLVLPVTSDIIIVSTENNEALTSQLPSSRCLRRFSIDMSTDHAVNAKGADADTTATAVAGREVVIEENYGHAMGAHIWDASIWLSFAVWRCEVGDASGVIDGQVWWRQLKGSMLELSAGCGLFAAVYSQLVSRQRVMHPPSGLAGKPMWPALLLTERDEDSLTQLRANMETNSGLASNRMINVEMNPLVWGQLGAKAWRQHFQSQKQNQHIALVFASDVLYHWTAHDSFLETLDALEVAPGPHRRSQDKQGPCITSMTRIYVMHKHRGRATTDRLEAVLRDGVDIQCALESARDATSSQISACGWRRWRAVRVAKWGAIDLLQLCRREKLDDHTCIQWSYGAQQNEA